MVNSTAGNVSAAKAEPVGPATVRTEVAPALSRGGSLDVSSRNVFRDESIDSIFNGRVRVIQARRGYRFSFDAGLLAWWARGESGHGLDIGTGSGVVALSLLTIGAAHRMTAVEIQPAQADRARRSVALNGLSSRCEIIEGDARYTPLPSGPFDFVVANPPYFPVGAGKVNPVGEKALARHELSLTVTDLAQTAARYTAPGGSFRCMYLTARLDELASAMAGHGLRLTTALPLIPDIGRPSQLTLVHAVAQTAPVAPMHEPPLVLHSAPGKYTDEVEAILRGAFVERT